MPHVTAYPKGAPCWFELATTDQDAAKHFYPEVFGWSVLDAPMGGMGVYTMFQKDGQDAGAAYTLQPEMRQHGVPPHWEVYFAVPNCDETAAQVTKNGGSLLQPPFDVMDFGRMAVCQDPGHAVFCIWQAKATQGAGVMNENNTVGWVELATREMDKVVAFYTKIFGWHTKGSQNMPSYIEYTVPGNEHPSGGLMAMDAAWGEIPSHWGIYFLVADCNATAEKAKSLGATLRHGPFDAPGVGRIAIVADPQKAGFSIIQLNRPM